MEFSDIISEIISDSINTFAFLRETGILPLLAVLFIFTVILHSIRFFHNYRIKRKIRRLSRKATEITPAEFFQMRKERDYSKSSRRSGSSKRSGRGRGRSLSNRYDFSGVYILYNHSRNKYYVGQSKHVIKRVSDHFSGHGNGDVYADYKYGDRFTIKMISLRKSGFRTLNELERNTISTYNSFAKGYNRTRGNKG